MTLEQAIKNVETYLKAIEGQNVPQDLVAASVDAILALVA